MCVLETGRLMARFCVAFDTMKIFHSITGRETMEELVSLAFLLTKYHHFPFPHITWFRPDMNTIMLVFFP